MDPADLSDPGTDREKEDEHEIKFTSRIQKVEDPLSAPARAQATTDCEIINMVKTLNGAIAAVSQDTAFSGLLDGLTVFCGKYGPGGWPDTGGSVGMESSSAGI